MEIAESFELVDDGLTAYWRRNSREQSSRFENGEIERKEVCIFLFPVRINFLCAKLTFFPRQNILPK